MLISRHVVFNKSPFPFAFSNPPPDDLDPLFSSSPVVHPIAQTYPSSIVDTSVTVAMPRAAPVAQVVPHVPLTSTTAPRSTSMLTPHAALASLSALRMALT
jgi:hypothetical protein